LMRFHSPDSWSPFGEGGVNAYAYCEGDPIGNVDSTGHASIFTGLLRFIFRKAPRTTKVKVPGMATAGSKTSGVDTFISTLNKDVDLDKSGFFVDKQGRRLGASDHGGGIIRPDSVESASDLTQTRPALIHEKKRITAITKKTPKKPTLQRVGRGPVIAKLEKDFNEGVVRVRGEYHQKAGFLDVPRRYDKWAQ
jgi:hypothetical protein